MRNANESEQDSALKQVIGQNIQRLREEKHESQIMLAEELGIHRSAVNHWEKGRTQPSMRNLKQLAEHFGVSCDDLLKVPSKAPISDAMIESATAVADTLSAAFRALENEILSKRKKAGGKNNEQDAIENDGEADRGRPD